jgi:hypothetical protein
MRRVLNGQMDNKCFPILVTASREEVERDKRSRKVGQLWGLRFMARSRTDGLEKLLLVGS